MSPHVEKIVTCANGHRYCIICNHKGCPDCGINHLEDNRWSKYKCWKEDD